jgi:hypothetical protein
MAFRDLAVYLDDVTVPCDTVDQGIAILDVLFQRIQDAGFKLKASKCDLFRTSVRVLGFIVSADGIADDPSRVAAIRTLKFPTTTKQLRQLLGATGFARKFYKDYASVVLPLTSMLKKGARVWASPDALAAFERLKEIMSSPPVLCWFNPNAYEHILETDSSLLAFGSCLYQRETPDSELRIVSYFSGKFAPAEVYACVTKRELLGIIKSLKHFRPLLTAGKVKVRSDHACLRYLLTSRELLPQFARWSDFVSQFQLTIEYAPGKTQLISDWLSRAEFEDDNTPRPCEVNGIKRCKHCRTKAELRMQQCNAERRKKLNVQKSCEVSTGLGQHGGSHGTAHAHVKSPISVNKCVGVASTRCGAVSGAGGSPSVTVTPGGICRLGCDRDAQGGGQGGSAASASAVREACEQGAGSTADDVEPGGSRAADRRGLA